MNYCEAGLTDYILHFAMAIALILCAANLLTKAFQSMAQCAHGSVKAKNTALPIFARIALATLALYTAKALLESC